MEKYKIISILLVMVMAVSMISGCGCSKKGKEVSTVNLTSYEFSSTDVSYDSESDINYINNIILVFFNKSVSDARKKEIAKLVDGIKVGEDNSVDQIQLRVKTRNLSELKQLCEILEREEDVELATYDVATKIEKEPKEGGQKNTNKKSGKVMTSDEMKIGIVDSGFDSDHEDLNITILNPNVADKDDHGTHVAGIIGATNNNGIGIDGVVPNAKMLGYDWEPNKNQEWDTTSQVLSGLSSCVMSGAKIVNFSLGLDCDDLVNDRKKKSKALLDETARLASMYMSKLLDKGYDFAVVQSAGNGARNGVGIDAVNNGYFCSVNNNNCKTIGDVTSYDVINRIIVVAAASRPDKNGNVFLTKFSNGGSCVDVAAPGDNIYSLVCNNKYEKFSGTSMAAPMVSGYLAVEWDKDPSLSGDELKSLFKSLPKKAYDNPKSKYTKGSFPFVDLWDKFKDPDARPVITKAPTTKPPVKNDMETLLGYYSNGNYNEAARINNTFPEYAQEACVKNMPQKLRDDFYDTFYKMEGFGVEMYFTDVDNDNDADMLVKCGSSEADFYLTWFRNDNNTVVGASDEEIPAGHSSFSAYPNHNGFIRYEAHMDYEAIYLVQLENGRLVDKKIGERTTSNYLGLRNALKVQESNYVIDEY